MLLALIDAESLGRLDPLTMSQQSIMECLVAQLSDASQRAFRDKKKHFLDVKSWKGVVMDTVGYVGNIDWSDKHGSMDLRWLPDQVLYFRLSGDSQDDLVGTVEFCALPRHLRSLFLSNIGLTGEIDLSALPKMLEEFCVIHVPLHGALRFDGIPATLKYVSVKETPLSSIDLTCTSSALKSISVQSCALQGTLSFANSPPALEKLDLSDNTFVGFLDFAGLAQTATLLELHRNAFDAIRGNPPFVLRFVAAENRLTGTVELLASFAMRFYDASKNQLTGSLDLGKLPKPLIRLHLHTNQLTGSLDFGVLPALIQHIYLYDNQFSGAIDLDNLPAHLTKLQLQNNMLSGEIVLTNQPTIMRHIDLSNNRFVMDAIMLPVGCKKVPHIDLRGNTVGRVVSVLGRALNTKTILLE